MKKKIVLTILTLVTIYGCGQKDPKEVIKEKVTKRWEGKISENFDGSYDYLAPSQKQVISERNYLLGFGTELQYKSIDIKSITCDNEEDIKKAVSCNVKVYVKFKDKKREIDGGAQISETWVKEDKDWWIFKK